MGDQDLIIEAEDGRWTFPARMRVLPNEARAMAHGHMIGAPVREYIRADLAPTDAQVKKHSKVLALMDATDAMLTAKSDDDLFAAGQIARAVLRDLEDGNG